MEPFSSKLGRALGHFIFSLIGLKRILFTNIFQKLEKPHLVNRGLNNYQCCSLGFLASSLWEFPKLGVPHFGVLIIRILLFRVLY